MVPRRPDASKTRGGFDARERYPYGPVRLGRISPVWGTICETGYMAQGTVKCFSPDKGYGFIQPDDGGKDVFAHIRQVEEAGMHSLNEGQKISFDVVANPKNGKSSAENLRAV
jgi:cold shock protein